MRAETVDLPAPDRPVNQTVQPCSRFNIDSFLNNE
jgi:hypothetical protein